MAMTNDNTAVYVMINLGQEQIRMIGGQPDGQDT
jgi:hypothetical protein